MKLDKWTAALAAAGIVSFGSLGWAEETQHPVQTALSSTTLSGYVSTSAIWKFGTGNATLPGRSFDGTYNQGLFGKQDGFNLDVVKISLEKPLDESQWSAGYKVDLMAGPDAAAFRGSIGSGTSDFAVRQAYVAMRVPVGNGLDVKMGVFDNLIGYETFDSLNNPNYSRSYGYALEPLQHTGLLASYKVTDWLSFQAAAANTLNSAINERASRLAGAASESEKSYLGTLTLTAPESFGWLKGGSLFLGAVNGLNGVSTATAKRWTGLYAGVSIPTPLTGLSAGASYDYRANSVVGATSSSYGNAVSLYLSYQATEKLKFNNRAEYASGTGGTWGTVHGSTVFDPATGLPIQLGRNEEFFAETFTVDYAWWANVVTRAEFRWDHDLKGNPGSFGGGGKAGLSDDTNALSLALNVVYKF